MINIFFKLTSQKPEIRKQPTYKLNETVKNLPAWCHVRGGRYGLRWFRWFRRNYSDELKSGLKSLLRDSSGVYKVQYTYDDENSVLYTFAPWVPLISKMSRPFNSLVRSPMKMGLLDVFLEKRERIKSFQKVDKKIGLADVFRERERIKSFKLSDAINYSYHRDLRFVVFLCILFGFTIWMCVGPEPLLNQPRALSAPNVKILIGMIEDTYVHHTCSIHSPLFPCDCEEPLNQTIKEAFPLTSFDPLKIEKITKGQKLTVSIMVASIILSLALMESVSPHGISYIEL